MPRASVPCFLVQKAASPSLLLLLKYWKAVIRSPSWVFSSLGWIVTTFSNFSHMCASTILGTLVFVFWMEGQELSTLFHVWPNHNLSPAAYIRTDPCRKHRACFKGSQLVAIDPCSACSSQTSRSFPKYPRHPSPSCYCCMGLFQPRFAFLFVKHHTLNGLQIFQLVNISLYDSSSTWNDCF